MRPSNRQRGSALLFTLLATVAGCLILGLGVDAVALLSAKARLETVAEVAAEAARRAPAAPEKAAMEVFAKNGLPGAKVEIKDGLVAWSESEVYFLRVLRPEPVRIAARVEIPR